MKGKTRIYSWVPQLFDVLLPLSSDVISADAFRKQFYPVAQTDLIKNGAIYGIPLEIDTLSLFINTELFQAASLETPTTWEDFAKSARVLTVKDETGRIKTSGAALGTFDNITHAPDIVSLLFVQNGADIKNLLKTDQASSDALSFYASFASGEGNVWDQTLDPSILAFAKGNLAMYFGYSWDVFTIKAINPNLSFQIASVPHLPGRNMTIASYWAEGVSSKSKHQKEALLFMKFLAKKETQQKLFTEISKTRLFGEPYANKELKDLVKDNQFVYPFVSQADGAVSSFFSSDTFDDGLNSQMNAYLGNAVRSIL
ncbi:MAG: extracellular solute-binding protein, partial [Candidatus Levybacteria bacterium]|nr:extracellular solute-binding protein [Candidatus Levybacteria bacterium]